MSDTHRLKATLEMISTVAVIAASGAVVWALLMRPNDGPPVRAPIEDITEAIDAAHTSNVTGAGSIAIVEFSDFQCPFCGQYARDTFPTLKRELIDSGVIRYVALHFPLEQIHPYALTAAVAAECAAKQDRFWDMHRELFNDSTQLARGDLLEHAELVGLERAVFEACLESDETLPDVRADQAEGRRLGVVSTPTFFVGTVRSDGGIELRRRINGAVDAEVLTSEVRALVTGEPS